MFTNLYFHKGIMFFLPLFTSPNQSLFILLPPITWGKMLFSKWGQCPPPPLSKLQIQHTTQQPIHFGFVINNNSNTSIGLLHNNPKCNGVEPFLFIILLFLFVTNSSITSFERPHHITICHHYISICHGVFPSLSRISFGLSRVSFGLSISFLFFITFLYIPFIHDYSTFLYSLFLIN